VGDWVVYLHRCTTINSSRCPAWRSTSRARRLGVVNGAGLSNRCTAYLFRLPPTVLEVPGSYCAKT
jgi:hypothetical protein